MSNSAQEAYNDLYIETARRHRAKGTTPPNEVEIFRTLVKYTREQVLAGNAHPDMVKELESVRPHIAVEREKEIIALERDKAIREGRPFTPEDFKNLILKK
jgi:hypothetical protein